MMKTFSFIMEVVLIITALAVGFLIFKYPRQILITLPKAIFFSVIKIFQEEMTGLIDVFSKKKNNKKKQK